LAIRLAVGNCSRPVSGGGTDEAHVLSETLNGSVTLQPDTEV